MVVSMNSKFLAVATLTIIIAKETKQVSRSTNGIEPKDFFSLRYLTSFIADHKNKIGIKKVITG
jgi:hypothetical protein